MKKVWLIALLLAALPLAGLAAPVTIFSNFGSPQHFDSQFGLSVNQALGVAFVAPDPNVPGFVYGIESINFAALTSDSNSNPATIGLFADAAGAPGASLASMNVVLNTAATEYHVTAPFNAAMTPGGVYWIVLSSSFPFDVTWNAAGNGALGVASLGQSWEFLESYAQGAVQVNAVLVEGPEPATSALLATGIAAVVLASRRRRI